MDKVEKIRQEIKRRYNYENEMYHKKKPDGWSNDGWAESLAIMGVLEELLTFLDTLSEEPDKSLEEVANDFANQDCVTFISRKKGFIAGAEWMEKEINKELLKAMEKVHEIRDVDYDIHIDTSTDGSFETISYYENGKLVGQEQSKKTE